MDPFLQLGTSLLKANLQDKPKNYAGKRKGTKENKTTGANHDHYGRGCHHGQAVAPTTAHGGAHGQAVVAYGRLPVVYLLRCILVHLFGSRVFALDRPSWVYWTSFATSLHLVGLNFSTFPNIWLDTCKSAIKTRTSQN